MAWYHAPSTLALSTLRMAGFADKLSFHADSAISKVGGPHSYPPWGEGFSAPPNKHTWGTLYKGSPGVRMPKTYKSLKENNKTQANSTPRAGQRPGPKGGAVGLRVIVFLQAFVGFWPLNARRPLIRRTLGTFIRSRGVPDILYLGTW